MAAVGYGKGKLLEATILYPAPNFTQEDFHRLARTKEAEAPPEPPVESPAPRNRRS